jgi:hypothetical protein
MGIIKHNGLTVGRSFGKADIPRNNGRKHRILKIGAYLFYHVICKLGSGVVHGKKNPPYSQRPVQAALNTPDGLQKQA